MTDTQKFLEKFQAIRDEISSEINKPLAEELVVDHNMPLATELLLALIDNLGHWPEIEKVNTPKNNGYGPAAKKRRDAAVNRRLGTPGYYLKPDLIQKKIGKFEHLDELLDILQDAQLIEKHKAYDYDQSLEDDDDLRVITLQRDNLLDWIQIYRDFVDEEENDLWQTKMMPFEINKKFDNVEVKIHSVVEKYGYPCVIRLMTEENWSRDIGDMPDDYDEQKRYYKRYPEIRLRGAVAEMAIGLPKRKYRATPYTLHKWKVRFSGIVERAKNCPAFVEITNPLNIKFL